MSDVSFNIVSAESLGNTHVAITFDALPLPSQAITLANYSIPGLTLTGGFATVIDNLVVLDTSAQGPGQYTVTVSGVTRAQDGQGLTTKDASFAGSGTFNIVAAEAVSSTAVLVTFDAPPDPFYFFPPQLNLSIPGLTVSAAVVDGNRVFLTTSPQAAIAYTVTAAINVTRESDGLALTTTSANFAGRAPFNVVSAVSTGAHRLVITFDAPPGAVQAGTIDNYSVVGLQVSGTPVVVGNTATITTSAQADTTYTVTVNKNVQRASDAENLTAVSADFTGRTEFSVVSATSTSHLQSTVTFSHAPSAAQAVVLANYLVNQGLILTGVPILVDNTVTITTTAQSAVLVTINVNHATNPAKPSCGQARH